MNPTLVMPIAQKASLPVAVYVVHVQKRQTGMLKTDKRDALNLANTLYSQLELGVQVAEKLSLVRRALPATKAALQLKGLIRHRYELIQESTQRRNKLTALCDEIFPELTLVLKDPNSPTALAIRERFPSPQALATASLAALQDVRGNNRSLSDGKLMELQRLAGQSIGIKDVNRQRGLVLEQSLLIKELRLIQHHLEQLEVEICQIVEQSREGQILMSIPGIGPLSAATLIATIGNIANFSRASELKSSSSMGTHQRADRDLFRPKRAHAWWCEIDQADYVPHCLARYQAEGQRVCTAV
jgi:transposase